MAPRYAKPVRSSAFRFVLFFHDLATHFGPLVTLLLSGCPPFLVKCLSEDDHSLSVFHEAQHELHIFNAIYLIYKRSI